MTAYKAKVKVIALVSDMKQKYRTEAIMQNMKQKHVAGAELEIARVRYAVFFE